MHHIAPYFASQVTVLYKNAGLFDHTAPIHPYDYLSVLIGDAKMLLKDCKDITNEEIDDLNDIYDDEGIGYNDRYEHDMNLDHSFWYIEPYPIVAQLVEWGYDVFGLIEKNLALKYEER